jgi:hypothetical protein
MIWKWGLFKGWGNEASLKNCPPMHDQQQLADSDAKFLVPD